MNIPYSIPKVSTKTVNDFSPLAWIFKGHFYTQFSIFGGYLVFMNKNNNYKLN